MENKILSNELVEAIHKVGELVKNDPRHIAIVEKSAEYSSNEEIVKQLDEYGALQAALATQFEEGNTDDEVVEKLKNRMDNIYTSVTGNPIYVAFKEASDEYEALTNEIYAELEYAVTGHRHDESCTHDCSTCSGCH